MTPQPNVVLVVMDTTRADDGFDSAVAPTLADIGTAGARATEAIAAAPWTLPSHASMLTGTYPSKHGAHAGHELLDDSLSLLPELFQEAGYDTVCVSNNTWLSIESGFDRGFDSFQQMWQLVQSSTALGELVDVTEERRFKAVARKIIDGNPVANVANVLYRHLVRDRSDKGGERTTEWINQWLEDREDDNPFFLFTNYLEPHLEYRPPKRRADQFLPNTHTYEEAVEIPQEPWEYAAGNLELGDADFRALRGLYRAEIAYLDEQLAELKRALIKSGEWENTVLIVTADHGENIGHHGLMDHQYCLYDSLVHVPLVVQGGQFDDYGEITDLVSLTDIAPTLLDVAGIEAPKARESFQGRSFHPDSDDSSHEFVISEYMAPQPSMDALERHVEDLPSEIYEFDRSLRSIRTTEHKLVRGSDGTTELYDLVNDPGETTNVSGERPALVEQLSGKLDEWIHAFDQAETDGDVLIEGNRKKQLENLGYIQ